MCCTKFRALNPNLHILLFLFRKGRKEKKRQKKQNIYRTIMALIVGDDFQHILRVLNTNVDGREKVRKREFVFIVRVVRVCARARLKFKPRFHIF